MKTNLHKISDFIDNDVILLGPVTFVQNTQKNEIYSLFPYYSIESISHHMALAF